MSKKETDMKTETLPTIHAVQFNDGTNYGWDRKDTLTVIGSVRCKDFVADYDRGIIYFSFDGRGFMISMHNVKLFYTSPINKS